MTVNMEVGKRRFEEGYGNNWDELEFVCLKSRGWGKPSRIFEVLES